VKRTSILLAALASLALTGCATNYDAYAKAQESIVKAQSDAETARLVALARIAETGDASARLAAVMTLAFTGNRGGVTQMAAPQNMALEWAKVLVNPLVNIWGITETNRTTRHASDNSVASQAITFGALENIAVKGMDEAGKVVFPPVYTVPMGSAPAAPAEPVPAPAPVPAE
jgi:hypothetical protein